MSVAKYRAGETVYYYDNREITKATITSCTVYEDEIEYIVVGQEKQQSSRFSEEGLFPTALDAAKHYKQRLLNMIFDYNKLIETWTKDIKKLEASYEC